MPRIEMPWSVQNVRFSAATSGLLDASRASCRSSAAVRFWMAKLPSCALAVVVVDECGCGLEVGVRGRAAVVVV